MNYCRFLFSSLFLLVLLASSSSGQAVRTFVASTGSDSNPCSRIAPCRTFQAAVNEAAPGGEVVALDSAGFGSNVNINKSISIIASPGVYSFITVLPGGPIDGIDINAGASDTIVLRGLTVISQFSSASVGIAFNTGGTLYIENCVVNGFGDGVDFMPSGSANLEVKDSTMRGNSTSTGIFIFGNAQAVIDHVRVENGRDGIAARDGARVTIRNSVASGNNVRGFVVASFSSASAEMNIEGCVASNNAEAGIEAFTTNTGTATARVSSCTVTDNGIGFNRLGGNSAILSRGNNTVEGNTMDTSGTIGSYTAK